MISRPYSTVEFYTTSTPNSVSSYCNNTLVLRVRDSYYKYQSVKRTEAPACPLAQASCTTRTSDSPTRLYVFTLAEWLTRWPAKPFPFGSAGSSPADDDLFFHLINLIPKIWTIFQILFRVEGKGMSYIGYTNYMASSMKRENLEYGKATISEPDFEINVNSLVEKLIVGLKLFGFADYFQYTNTLGIFISVDEDNVYRIKLRTGIHKNFYFCNEIGSSEREFENWKFNVSGLRIEIGNVGTSRSAQRNHNKGISLDRLAERNLGPRTISKILVASGSVSYIAQPSLYNISKFLVSRKSGIIISERDDEYNSICVLSEAIWIEHKKRDSSLRSSGNIFKNYQEWPERVVEFTKKKNIRNSQKSRINEILVTINISNQKNIKIYLVANISGFENGIHQ
ncbi:hypothetical protein H8356DRAFT_1351674 [Neocallimastix lanati (nom. inval.)]|nr:hypothetical protein H8356DRAFT_1351674 [Neocallimastix sp. JGI-2020a]